MTGAELTEYRVKRRPVYIATVQHRAPNGRAVVWSDLESPTKELLSAKVEKFERETQVFQERLSSRFTQGKMISETWKPRFKDLPMIGKTTRGMFSR